jgi:hypothetical protein
MTMIMDIDGYDSEAEMIGDSKDGDSDNTTIDTQTSSIYDLMLG